MKLVMQLGSEVARLCIRGLHGWIFELFNDNVQMISTDRCYHSRLLDLDPSMLPFYITSLHLLSPKI